MEEKRYHTNLKSNNLKTEVITKLNNILCTYKYIINV